MQGMALKPNELIVTELRVIVGKDTDLKIRATP
jgi:hypothetical protein